jgi:glycosyltransferase involved in cell wall biosynthesis
MRGVLSANIPYSKAKKDAITLDTRDLLNTWQQTGKSTLHIVSLNVQPNDAVSNHSLELAIFFSAMGCQVRMYARNSHEIFSAIQNPRETLFTSVQPNDVVLYQFSIGDEFMERVAALNATTIAYFHGITPPELLNQTDTALKVACQRGLEQIPLLLNFDRVFASSHFNLTEAVTNVGEFKNSPAVLPPYLTCRPTYPGKKSDPPFLKLLYVGRFFPHKNVEAVLHFFFHFRKRYRGAILRLVGGSGLADYWQSLTAMLPKLFGDDHASIVALVGELTDEQLDLAYSESGCLLQFSNHEGFCVPLLEGMNADCLVITHDRGALKETMQGAGILIETSKMEAEAARVAELIADPTKNADLLATQRRVFDSRYSNKSVQTEYLRQLGASLGFTESI